MGLTATNIEKPVGIGGEKKSVTADALGGASNH